jgi:hypothetical protein
VGIVDFVLIALLFNKNKNAYENFCIAILNSTRKNALSSLLGLSLFFNKTSDKGRTGPAWN